VSTTFGSTEGKFTTITSPVEVNPNEITGVDGELLHGDTPPNSFEEIKLSTTNPTNTPESTSPNFNSEEAPAFSNSMEVDNQTDVSSNPNKESNFTNGNGMTISFISLTCICGGDGGLIDGDIITRSFLRDVGSAH